MELHEQVNRLKEELATHKKDIAYARETVEIANSTIIRQHDQINGLGDINIAQAAELSKLREQLKAQQANQELVVNVTAKVTGLDELQELTHRLAHYERLTRAAK
jgi:chromosome segregation ATPase